MKNKSTISAEQSAGEMLRIPINELPELASEFLTFVSKKIGICLETCFTAFVYYSVAVLELKCENSDYIHSEWMIDWWNSKGYNLNK